MNKHVNAGYFYNLLTIRLQPFKKNARRKIAASK